MPGAQDRPFDSEGTIDRAIKVNKEWEIHARTAHPILRTLLAFKSNDDNMCVSILKLLAEAVHLHHMFESVQSAKIAKEDQENVSAPLKNLTQPDRRPIDLVQREIWSLDACAHRASLFTIQLAHHLLSLILNSIAA
jgi:hypothetical protein